MLEQVQLEVFRNLFHSIAEEMGVALCRTAFSPNIKERRDYSCAIFDADGHTVAQGDHMPVHLGSMPMSVAAAIEAIDMAAGDVVIVNDPFQGGTHLPDITLVQPVFVEGHHRAAFYVANRAHHSDVGGISPGSMPLATSIYQEGIRIPPMHLVRSGVVVEEAMKLILANVRTPVEREGDLTAQIASNRTGERRLLELVDRYSLPTVAEAMGQLQDYAERLTREAIRGMANGRFVFEDAMDDDGFGNGPLPIRVAIEVEDENVTVDFAGTAPQTAGSINAVSAITVSAVFYCFRVIVDWPIPTNHGTLRPLSVKIPAGSLLDARPPAAVAAGNVETSQRIVDTVLGAMAQALPGVIPAASSGTMNNLTIGGVDPRDGRQYAYYETTAGGMGARPGASGLDATHTHMTNSLNTPVEALEHSYPFRVRRYGVRRGSGGLGRHRGGDGIRRDIEILGDARVTVLADRRESSPYGLAGGQHGAPGRTVLVDDGHDRDLPGKCSLDVKRGAVVSLRTPGGGGFGAAGEDSS
ncbi:MAG: hydantoinase B/oxoprolinase family protein [Acidobacteria bacterium]|nr:hydantoinase B/oxoprolinase family protein [Acidobacteriota bacterium]